MGFDAIYLVENGSSDATPEIIESYGDKHPVFIQHDPRIGYELHLTEYYHWASADRALDWLFFIDCDEFIYFSDGVKNYLHKLAPDINCLRLRHREMLPRHNKNKSFGWVLDTFRASPCFGDTYKEVGKYHSKAKVYTGKHRLDFPGKQAKVPEDLYIRHYAYRSPQQARQKERNRVTSHAAFTEEDLRELSSFDISTSKEWFQYRKAYFENEDWRKYFNYSLPYEEDNALVDWKCDYMQRRSFSP